MPYLDAFVAAALSLPLSPLSSTSGNEPAMTFQSKGGESGGRRCIEGLPKHYREWADEQILHAAPGATELRPRREAEAAQAVMERCFTGEEVLEFIAAVARFLHLVQAVRVAEQQYARAARLAHALYGSGHTRSTCALLLLTRTPPVSHLTPTHSHSRSMYLCLFCDLFGIASLTTTASIARALNNQITNGNPEQRLELCVNRRALSSTSASSMPLSPLLTPRYPPAPTYVLLCRFCMLICLKNRSGVVVSLDNGVKRKKLK